MTYDLIVRHGVVLDGLGNPPAMADVGVLDDRIVAVGDLKQDHAAREIDATGKHVSPGFVDIHTHSDISATFHPQQESIVSQGVTTQVVGNCSLCIGLCTSEPVFEWEQKILGAHGARIQWTSVAEHLRYVADHGIAANYVMLAGQGTLRKRFVGMEERNPDSRELAAMCDAVTNACEEGAWGISTGLEYTPSSYADIDELVALTSRVAPFGGVYASHLRNEADLLEEAVAEALEIGTRAGTAVQLSHHKAEGRSNWGKVHSTLKMVENARAAGLDVWLDQYPYTAFHNGLHTQFLPAWANSGANDTVLARIRDDETRQKIILDMRTNHPDWDDLGPDSLWHSVQIGVCRNHKEIQGRTIAQLARDRGMGPIETVLDIIQSENGYVGAVNFAIHEDDIAVVMRHPLTMIGSDAVGTSPRGKMGEDRVHPRSYGTFPRILGRYVRELGVLTEPEAIRKMTSMPADRMGLPDRGRIEVGCYADLVVYDPSTVGDTATFENPHQFAAGIIEVFVNGRSAWAAGASTGTLAGKVLRKHQSSL